ncbi:hypothetical protein [Cupriavidus sp. UYPR2.512]|uniref:hypothetical protein n=1 Tax=Cupriavidus sp. UYPR2.512 TaxID=1080187 RepID=UPI00035FDB8F|nr:hypothetical protein [Cupriavidus sp. UYPR2.512]UIF90840.1 hypothetical protein KAF44_32140 [Cupriavidus necator]
MILSNLLRLLAPRFTLYCCSDSAPDTSAIAASNERAAELAKQSADDNLAFQKQQYADLQPSLKNSLDISSEASRQQMDLARQAQDRSDEQWDYYKDTFQPVEKQMVQEAMDYGSAADQNQQAGTARADMTASFDSQREQANRQLTAMGVNPNSGKFASANRMTDIAQAAQTAAGMTGARTAARDKGIALRAGAASFGRNMTNTAGQNLTSAVGAGSAAAGTSGAGIGNTLAAGNSVSGAYGMGINAANTAISANNSTVGAMNLGVQAASSNNQSMGSMAGAAVGAGALLL